jgi:hypothetical protein
MTNVNVFVNEMACFFFFVIYLSFELAVANPEQHVKQHLGYQGIPESAIKFRVPVSNSFFNGISFTVDYDHGGYYLVNQSQKLPLDINLMTCFS